MNKKETKVVHAIVEADLLRRFKIKAAAEGLTMSEVIVEAIKQYVKGVKR